MSSYLFKTIVPLLFFLFPSDKVNHSTISRGKHIRLGIGAFHITYLQPHFFIGILNNILRNVFIPYRFQNETIEIIRIIIYTTIKFRYSHNRFYKSKTNWWKGKLHKSKKKAD